MDPINLSERLRQQPARAGQAWPQTPPSPRDWLRFWNGAGANLGGLRNHQPWLSRARRIRTARI